MKSAIAAAVVAASFVAPLAVGAPGGAVVGGGGGEGASRVAFDGKSLHESESRLSNESLLAEVEKAS